MSADLALIGGNVLTMNPSKLHAEAIAVKGDRIAKVGTNEEISSLIGKNTKVIRLEGKTVLPGFIDTHIHIVDFGRLLTWLDLSYVRSIKEMQNSLSSRIQKTPKSKWVIGRGWNQNQFAEKRLPTRFDLDKVSIDNPVIFYHQGGQLCVVNTKALELAGITMLTSPPAGGVIDKDAGTGELTGVFRDNTMNLIWNAIPEPSEEELVDAAGLACEKILEAGVTSVHWMVSSSVDLSIIQKLREQNRLPIRVHIIIPANLLDNLTSSKSHKNFEDDALRLGGAVIFADGYLAARTAALFQPYSDDLATSGKLLCTQEEMNASAAKILNIGLQLVIHAMGDKAVDAALTTIEQTLTKVPRKVIRNRVEQAAILSKRLLKRMKKQKVIVSVQPCVIASEFSVWSAMKHLGSKRARWLFPIKTMLKEGIRIIGGSDCPMEPLNPLLGIQATVTRNFFPEERITVVEALRMYTVDAAYSSGEESIKGSIEEGKLADLAVISQDLLMVPLNEIENIVVEMTVVGGKVVYSKH
jgi:predicted amidohydrolase YtcJ